MEPTFQGFVSWVTNVMGVPADAMPSTTVLQYAYDWAIDVVYWALDTIPCQPTSPNIYAIAVYNLAGATLVEIAQDTPPSTYWADLRKNMNINSFQYGLISGAHDQGTGEETWIPQQLKNMTLMDLQLSKTPWGRAYLAIAGQWGYVWGIT